MSNYNPKKAYYSRRNKTQKNGDSKRDKHRYSDSQGGYASNYKMRNEK